MGSGEVESHRAEKLGVAGPLTCRDDSGSNGSGRAQYAASAVEPSLWVSERVRIVRPACCSSRTSPPDQSGDEPSASACVRATSPTSSGPGGPPSTPRVATVQTVACGPSSPADAYRTSAPVHISAGATDGALTGAPPHVAQRSRPRPGARSPRAKRRGRATARRSSRRCRPARRYRPGTGRLRALRRSSQRRVARSIAQRWPRHRPRGEAVPPRCAGLRGPPPHR